MTKIKIHKIRRNEFDRQYNLRQSWIQLNELMISINNFINKKSNYQKDNFEWNMYINQLDGSIKSILRNNTVSLQKTPYRIIIPHLNKLNMLSNDSEILAELNLLINLVNKKSYAYNT